MIYASTSVASDKNEFKDSFDYLTNESRFIHVLYQEVHQFGIETITYKQTPTFTKALIMRLDVTHTKNLDT